MKIRTLKTLLWFLFGTGLTMIVLRIIHGPGSVSALTDITPWGLWKGGGVVALVPIGGAGFTLAALVYIFHIERFRPLAIGGVLLGLMCYSSVGTGLMFDIGIWWRIVFPVTFWQFHSTLFEIAWCIMLYLCVLMVEFSHVVAAKFELVRLEKILHKLGIFFVIAGIALSTLHQSSLGTLFLATPYRLHPLWYTNFLPFFFFITSIGLGCLTISWVAIMAHRLYGAEQPMGAISGLGRIASFILLFYAILKLAEVAASGEASLLFSANWDTFNFWIELLLSAIIPSVLLFKNSYRNSSQAMFWIATMAIIGVSLNRLNVAGLAAVSATHEFYLPAWTEWVVTLGILSGAGLVFFFMVERFEVFPAIDPARVKATYSPGTPDHAAWWTVFFYNPGSEIRLYSASFVISAGLALGFASDNAVFGVSPNETTAHGPRISKVSNKGAPMLLIDGNRDGNAVLFDHELHIAKQGGGKDSCVKCHHMKMLNEEVSMCSDCHSDMYVATDIFDHESHTKHLKGNAGCVQCHTDPAKLKVRENTTPCAECHEQMRPENTLVSIPAKEKQSTMAPGYMDALHGLCIDCHKKSIKTLTRPDENFARCAQCHTGSAPEQDTKRILSQPMAMR